MNIILKLFDKISTKKSSFFPLIFTNDPNCPGHEFLKIFKTLGNNNFSHISNPLERQTFEKCNGSHLFMVAHGVPESNNFKIQSDGELINIPNHHFENIATSDHTGYFHVCYGANILKNNPSISQKFKNWVSYNEKVFLLQSLHPFIQEMHQNFIKNILKTSIVPTSNTKTLESKIIEEYKRQLKQIEINDLQGKFAVISVIEGNIKSITSS